MDPAQLADLDPAKLIIGGLGALAAIVAMVVVSFRARSVNREDPLQRRLASHIETYARSAKDDEAFDRFKADLKAELKSRSVPREEWGFRVTAATSLLDPALAGPNVNTVVDAITRLKWTP